MMAEQVLIVQLGLARDSEHDRAEAAEARVAELAPADASGNKEQT